ncbi:MAG: iron-containing alcohol dehydrogenase [Desulfobacteraceae bacterium]|nr:iron-containing alcohol dehydrogenase [Desulfobacteraceae bacterium]
MTQFNGKTKICYDENAMEVLETLDAKHALLVTDPFMVKTGFSKRIVSHLERANIAYTIFGNVEPDPSLNTVKQGMLAMDDATDVIIALGGGSAIDTAKAILYFCYKAAPEGKKPILVAIPTTSGTGSEVTAFSVVTDTEKGIKLPLVDELMIPDMAVLDARFTRTVPASVTAATGMDVLTHAIEAYTARKANAFTNLYAEQAIKYVFKYLARSYSNGDDMIAREKMLLASCMAGMAFNNAGLGICHSVAHALGGAFHVPHGKANSLVLPHAIRFNTFDAGEKYRSIAALLGLPSATIDEGVTSLVHGIEWLNEQMGIPSRVRDLGIEQADYSAAIPTMAAHALDDPCTEGTPRLPSISDLKTIFEQLY